MAALAGQHRRRALPHHPSTLLLSLLLRGGAVESALLPAVGQLALSVLPRRIQPPRVRVDGAASLRVRVRGRDRRAPGSADTTGIRTAVCPSEHGAVARRPAE